MDRSVEGWICMEWLERLQVYPVNWLRNEFPLVLVHRKMTESDGQNTDVTSDVEIWIDWSCLMLFVDDTDKNMHVALLNWQWLAIFLMLNAFDLLLLHLLWRFMDGWMDMWCTKVFQSFQRDGDVVDRHCLVVPTSGLVLWHRLTRRCPYHNQVAPRTRSRSL